VDLCNIKKHLVRIKVKLFYEAMNAYYRGDYVKEDKFLNAYSVLEEAIDKLNKLLKED